MTKWQGILIQCAISALITALGAMNSENNKGEVAAVGAALTAVTGAVTSRVSKHNPDGTPAETPYETPEKAKIISNIKE